MKWLLLTSVVLFIVPEALGNDRSICVPGVNSPNGDLPNMPLPGRSEDPHAACAADCLAHADCVLFSFHEPNCDKKCQSPTGCCWLKANETEEAPVISQCSCTGYVRAPPNDYTPLRPPPPNAPNVLHIMVDDLRPELQAYGQGYTVNPHITKLAARSLVFSNAYCQISVCSPSRMSFLTSRRPDTSRIWNFVDHFRQADCGIPKANARWTGVPVTNVTVPQGMAWSYDGAKSLCNLFSDQGTSEFSPGIISGTKGTLRTHAQWTSLPENFKKNGYLVAGTGKVFHTEEGGVGNLEPNANGPGMPPNEDPQSWSSPSLSMRHVNGVAPMLGCSTQGQPLCAINATMNGTILDPNEGQLCDKVIADDAIMKLRLLAANKNQTGQPFFLAVGFRKPHLAFRFPKPFLSLFPPQDQIVIAKHPTQDPSVPPIAHHDDAPQGNPFVAVETSVAQQWRLHYMAAVAWMDSQLGRVMDELDALGLTNDTIVALHSDHGWSLGEHGSWQKFTNWETGARVPLIVHSPAHPQSHGKNTSVLAELIDVYPTLNALVGIPNPETLEGQSLVPVLQAPDDPSVRHELRQFALSQYMRCPRDTTNSSNFWEKNNCLMMDRTMFPFMGYSLRTDQWRYTEWVRWNGTTLKPIWSEQVGAELYDHTGDDGTNFDAFENTNQKDDHADVVRQLSELLHQLVDGEW